MITRFAIPVFVGLLVLPAVRLSAQQHPRGRQQSQSQQVSPTTSKPQSTAEPLVVTEAEIFAGVKKYIYTHAQKSADKKFHLQSGGKDVALDLVTVHADRLWDLGENKHAVCVDMKAANSTTYDIDFFMTVHSGTLSVTEASVHKVNGKPLYNWKEQNGISKKVPAS